MELFAVFEAWHLADGNYPPLGKGQLVNLSFEVQPDELDLAKDKEPPEFIHLEEATYRFTGSVLRVYRGKGEQTSIVIVEAGHLRFYIHSPKASTFKPGDVISGRGALLLDHYIWVEFLSSYPDPPDLFYTLRVGDICGYRIPERFIKRSERGLAFPTRVKPEDYGPDDIASVDAISDGDYDNYVVQFSDRDIPADPIPRTFRS